MDKTTSRTLPLMSLQEPPIPVNESEVLLMKETSNSFVGTFKTTCVIALVSRMSSSSSIDRYYCKLKEPVAKQHSSYDNNQFFHHRLLCWFQGFINFGIVTLFLYLSNNPLEDSWDLSTDCAIFTLNAEWKGEEFRRKGGRNCVDSEICIVKSDVWRQFNIYYKSLQTTFVLKSSGSLDMIFVSPLALKYGCLRITRDSCVQYFCVNIHEDSFLKRYSDLSSWKEKICFKIDLNVKSLI